MHVCIFFKESVDGQCRPALVRVCTPAGRALCTMCNFFPVSLAIPNIGGLHNVQRIENV